MDTNGIRACAPEVSDPRRPHPDLGTPALVEAHSQERIVLWIEAITPPSSVGLAVDLNEWQVLQFATSFRTSATVKPPVSFECGQNLDTLAQSGRSSLPSHVVTPGEAVKPEMWIG